MIDVKTIEEAHADCDPAVCDVQPIIAERDALKGELATVRWDRECLQKRRDELETDNELLRAEVERHNIAFDLLSDAFNSQQTQLAELREAAEAVDSSILEGDWTSDAWRYALDHMRTVLAKVAK